MQNPPRKRRNLAAVNPAAPLVFNLEATTSRSDSWFYGLTCTVPTILAPVVSIAFGKACGLSELVELDLGSHEMI